MGLWQAGVSEACGPELSVVGVAGEGIRDLQGPQSQGPAGASVIRLCLKHYKANQPLL